MTGDDRLVGIVRQHPDALLGAHTWGAPSADLGDTVLVELNDVGGVRTVRRLVLFAAFAAGAVVGLLVAVALIPDQPTRVLVPVELPAPSAHVQEGVGA